jgi:hypothetical protein
MMTDFKSKLPDLKELADMTGKFFKDMKESVCEIMDDYKKKRKVDETQASGDVTASPSTPPAAEKKKSRKEKPQP